MAKFVVMMVMILSTLTCESVHAVSETALNMWRSIHSAALSLGDDAHSYLESLLGKNTVDNLLKTIEEAKEVASQAAGHALNFLHAAGLNDKLLAEWFTLENVVFVAKWPLLAVLGYWLLPVAVLLIFHFVRWVIKKVAGLGLACALVVIKASFSMSNTYLKKKFQKLKKKKNK